MKISKPQIKWVKRWLKIMTAIAIFLSLSMGGVHFVTHPNPWHLNFKTVKIKSINSYQELLAYDSKTETYSYQSYPANFWENPFYQSVKGFPGETYLHPLTYDRLNNDYTVCLGNISYLGSCEYGEEAYFYIDQQTNIFWIKVAPTWPNRIYGYTLIGEGEPELLGDWFGPFLLKEK